MGVAGGCSVASFSRSDTVPGNIAASVVLFRLSDDFRVESLPLLDFLDFFSLLSFSLLLLSLSFRRISFTVCNPASSHLTEVAPELPDDSRDLVDIGRREEAVDIVEPDRPRARIPPPNKFAESTDKRWLTVLAGAIEDAVDPLRDEGKRIVEGRPSPRMLAFFFPRDLDSCLEPAGLADNAPASKLLPE